MLLPVEQSKAIADETQTHQNNATNHVVLTQRQTRTPEHRRAAAIPAACHTRLTPSSEKKWGVEQTERRKGEQEWEEMESKERGQG